MKLPLKKASSIISEEDKDNKSSSSNSSCSEILEGGKESLSVACGHTLDHQDGILVSDREQVQQQFLNKSQQLCDISDRSYLQNLPKEDKTINQGDSARVLDVHDSLKPDSVKQVSLPLNADLISQEYHTFADPSANLNQMHPYDSIPLLPLILPSSSKLPLTERQSISMPERLTSVFPEDFRVEIPSATDINMETASCLWPDDHIKQHNFLSLKSQMVPQNFPGMSLFQAEQQQQNMLPYVGTLFENYYPFMVYSNPHINGLEEPQQFEQEIISSDCRLQKLDEDDDNNEQFNGKQLIPRFMNKKEIGWQTQPKIRIELECPETLQSFSSIPFISEKHCSNNYHNIYPSQTAMFRETKQPACLSQKNYPFQTNFNRPSFIHFQDNPNKDALDFKTQREEIPSDLQVHQSQIGSEFQAVYGEQIQEESEKTEETPNGDDQNKNSSQFKLKYGLTIPNQNNYTPSKKIVNNTNPTKIKFHPIQRINIAFPNDYNGGKEVSDDESKIGVDGGSQCKLQLEDELHRQSFSFPSCGKLHEKTIEEEGTSLDQEGNAVKTLIMRLQQQQSTYFSNYYQYYHQNQEQLLPQEIAGFHNYPGQQQYPLPQQVSQGKIRKLQLNQDQFTESELKHQFDSLSRLQEEKSDNDGDIQKEEDDDEDEEQLDQKEGELPQQQQQSSYDCDSDEVNEKLPKKVTKKINKRNTSGDTSPSAKAKNKTSSLKRKESDMNIEVRSRKASSSSVSCNSGGSNKNKFDTKNLVKNFLNQFLSFVSSDEEHNTIAALLPQMNIDEQFQDELKTFFKHKKYNRALLKEFIHVSNYRILFTYFLRHRAQDWITYGRMKDKPSHSRALSNFIYICENHDEIKSWRFRYNFV